MQPVLQARAYVQKRKVTVFGLAKAIKMLNLKAKDYVCPHVSFHQHAGAIICFR